MSIKVIRVDVSQCVKDLLRDEFGAGTSQFVAGENKCSCDSCVAIEQEAEAGGRGWHVRARPCTEGCTREKAVSLAQWASIGQGPTPTSAARRAHAASARAAAPPKRESERGIAFSCSHAQNSCLLEAAAGTLERGRAPRERDVSLAQWASIGHTPAPTNAARQARTESARTAPPRERERRGGKGGDAFSCAHARES